MSQKPHSDSCAHVIREDLVSPREPVGKRIQVTHKGLFVYLFIYLI